jgi:hypothetical protein
MHMLKQYVKETFDGMEMEIEMEMDMETDGPAVVLIPRNTVSIPYCMFAAESSKFKLKNKKKVTEGDFCHNEANEDGDGCV